MHHLRVRIRRAVIVLTAISVAACADSPPPKPAGAASPAAASAPSSAPLTTAPPFQSVPPYAARPAGDLPPVVIGAPPRRDSVVYPVSADLDLLDPVIIGDACEGAGCAWAYRAVACDSITLHAFDSDYDVAVGTVSRGDTVTVDHTNLYVHAGAVVLRRDTLGWSRGDSLLLLRRYQPGAWQWSTGDVAWSGTAFWSDSTHQADSPVAELVRLPVTLQWLHVVPVHGPAGWWRRGTPGSIRDVTRAPPDDYCEPMNRN